MDAPRPFTLKTWLRWLALTLGSMLILAILGAVAAVSYRAAAGLALGAGCALAFGLCLAWTRQCFLPVRPDPGWYNHLGSWRIRAVSRLFAMTILATGAAGLYGATQLRLAALCLRPDQALDRLQVSDDRMVIAPFPLESGTYSVTEQATVNWIHSRCAATFQPGQDPIETGRLETLPGATVTSTARGWAVREVQVTSRLDDFGDAGSVLESAVLAVELRDVALNSFFDARGAQALTEEPGPVTATLRWHQPATRGQVVFAYLAPPINQFKDWLTPLRALADPSPWLTGLLGGVLALLAVPVFKPIVSGLVQDRLRSRAALRRGDWDEGGPSLADARRAPSKRNHRNERATD